MRKVRKENSKSLCRNSTTLSSALSVKKKPSAIGAAKCFPQRENLPKNAAVIAKPAAAAIDRRKRRTASTVRRLFFCLFYRHFSALPRRFAPFAASAALLYPLRPYPSFIFEETSFSVFRRYRQPYGLICTNFHGKDFQPHGFKRIRIFISADFNRRSLHRLYKKRYLYKTADPSTNEAITPAAPALRKQSASSSGSAILPLYSL